MYIYGKNVAKEFLNKNKMVQQAIISENFKDTTIIEQIEKKQIPIHFMSNQQMDKLVEGRHQGIILKVEEFQYTPLEDLKDATFLVILDHIEDPHNFGAIIRTCEAAKVEGIIIPKNRSVQVNSTVMKTSAGALLNMPIVQVTNLAQTMKQLKKQGFWFVGTDMNKQDYKTISYTGKIGIVIGSEGFGMSRLIYEECDYIASIPMLGKINSLNASVAAGIIIYEAVSQRK